MPESQHRGQEKAACNLEYLLINLGRNHAAALHLTRIFLDNYPLLIKRIEDGVRLADWSAVKDAAHDIRSSCVLFSADAAVMRAKVIESLLHQHADHPAEIDWQENVAELRSALQQVVTELQRYLDSKGAQ